MHPYKQQILDEYDSKIKLYKEFTYLTRNLLEVFLKGNNFKFQIFHRLKERIKLEEKIDRNIKIGKFYKELSDIEDISGTRIVFYLEDDKKGFLKLFKEEFDNCILNIEDVTDSRGYRGTHIIFQLDEKRSGLFEYQKYQGLKCEIQVSTILYHAWSEVEHDIIYKPEGEIKLLKTLGFDDLEQSFQKLMSEHIQAATIQLNLLNRKYKSISKAGKILKSDFISDISKSDDNDEIYEALELISGFAHKIPDESLEIINTVIRKIPKDPQIKYKFADRVIFGKKHSDLILKCIDLLSRIKYFKTESVLLLLSQLSQNTNVEARKKALEILKGLTKYNYHVLTKSDLGYSPQFMVLDFISKWSIDEKIGNIDFMETASKELLGTEIIGTELTGVDMITTYSGSIKPTEEIKRIRRATIDLIHDLFENTYDSKIKFRLVKVLEEATILPLGVKYGDDLVKIVVEDLDYLVDIYDKMIFSKGKLSESLSIVAVIEERLFWINEHRDNLATRKSKELQNKILSDEDYQLYKKFVGEVLIMRHEMHDWKEIEQNQSEEINKVINSINDSNIENWFMIFNKIASQIELIEDWNFQWFRTCIRKLAQVNPKIADKLLNKSFSGNYALQYFSVNFLEGFREGKHFDQWDRNVLTIIDSKDTNQIVGIISSLNLPSGYELDENIRDLDIEILENSANAENEFSFIKEYTDDVMWRIHSQLINTLFRLHKRAPFKLEKLLVQLIRDNINHLEFIFHVYKSSMHRKHLSIEGISTETLNFFKEMMVELKNLDWWTQELILNLGKLQGLDTLLDIFRKRIIESESKNKKEIPFLGVAMGYQPIPFQMNPQLKEFIGCHPEYIQKMKLWVADMTEDWSLYNVHVSNFIQGIEKGRKEIIQFLINKGDDKSLFNAARVLYTMYDTDFDLCVEVVRRTDNDRILSQISTNMYSTGAMVGEYAVAESFDNKAKILEKYKDDSKERVQKFVKGLIESFKKSAQSERQRVDEERQIRKIEFEG